MKRLIVIALFLLLTVQAQTVGSWQSFKLENGQTGIFNLSTTDKVGTLILRCNNSQLEVFVNAFVIVNERETTSFIYKVDSEPREDRVGILSSDYRAVFFIAPDLVSLIPKFLQARYFSVMIETQDKIRAYTFDLTGFGQALQYIPCAQAYLK